MILQGLKMKKISGLKKKHVQKTLVNSRIYFEHGVLTIRDEHEFLLYAKKMNEVGEL